MAHNSKLFNKLDEQTVAYLFMINMRMMFNYQNDNLQSYESILLQLSKKDNKQLLDKLNPNDVSNKVSDAYLELRNKVIKDNAENYILKNNILIDDDTLHFNELAKNIQLSKSKLRENAELFTKILYQMFWLITSNPMIDRRENGNFLEINFRRFRYQDKPYLFELARHIYNRSFG